MENRVTEQSSAYDNLQEMSIHDILTGINHEDSLVPAAVAKVIPVMEEMRSFADDMEGYTAKKYWPFPTYADILFSV